MKYQNKEWLQEQIKIHGDNGRQIALANNYAPVTVQRYMKKFNLYEIKEKKKAIIKAAKEPIYRNKEWLQKQFDLYETVTEVSRQTGFPRTCISRYADRYNIYVKKYTREKINSVNENYFKDINTEKKAYWLGFFMADANMYIYKDGRIQFSIKIKESDYNHLKKLKEDISFLGEVKTRCSIRNNTSCYCSEIKIYNKTFCKNLMKHGIVPNKTGKECFPDTLPNELAKHFIRGLLDGDGTIVNSKSVRASICCSDDKMLKQIKSFLLVEDIETKLYFYKNIYTLNTTKKVMSYNLLKFLYKDATIYLDRKYKKATVLMLEYELAYL